MGADKTKTIVPGHGTLFVADPDAVFPADWTDFTLTGPEPAGWTNVGHTSKGTQPAFSKEGGEATILDTWLADGVDVTYSSEQWSLGISALQIDEPNLDLAFGGFFDTDGAYVVPSSNPGLEGQAFLLATDGTGSLGFWMPNTSTKIGDAPSIDAANFFELPLSLKVLSADDDVIPANENGTPAIMKIFKSGLAAALPRVKSLSQASGAVGALIEITGSGFTGATGAGGVKFGAINAGVGKYLVVSDTKITVIVPTGSGSQPITVTTPSGTSTPAVAFTIS